jgi:hypothetical protein
LPYTLQAYLKAIDRYAKVKMGTEPAPWATFLWEFQEQALNDGIAPKFEGGIAFQWVTDPVDGHPALEYTSTVRSDEDLGDVTFFVAQRDGDAHRVLYLQPADHANALPVDGQVKEIYKLHVVQLTGPEGSVIMPLQFPGEAFWRCPNGDTSSPDCTFVREAIAPIAALQKTTYLMGPDQEEVESSAWLRGAIRMDVDLDPATGTEGFYLTQAYVATYAGAVSEMQGGYMCSRAPILQGDGSLAEDEGYYEFDPAARPDRCLKGSSATMSASLVDLPAGEYLVGFIAKDVLNNTSIISTTLTR